MTTIHSGKLQYLAGDFHRGEWVDCELKLLSDATLEVDHSGTQAKLDVGLLAVAAPLDSLCDNGFIIKSTEDEPKKYSSGPIFQAKTAKECREWMVKISETILKHKISTRHPHPLPSKGIYKQEGAKCATCSANYAYVQYHECEYCADYALCSACYTSFYNLPRYPIVTSATHPHQLVRPELIRNELLVGASSSKPECSRCHASCTGYHYVCAQCPDYFECSTCAYELIHNNEATPAKEMKFNLGNLEHVLHSPSPNSYVLDVTGKRAPKLMSVISQQHWDLSRVDLEPVPHAYFEVTFKQFNNLIGVGIGNQMFSQNEMLGQQQNSYGYLSNGQLFVSGPPLALEFPPFSAGDTIGAGILLDSFNLRRLYFTKNGEMIGCFPGRVHRGMDCFPGVSFSIEGVEFDVNMTGPFKFDTSSVPNYRNDKKNYFESLPKEVVAELVAYASYNGPDYVDPSFMGPVPCHDFALQLRLVSKRFKDASDDNTVWRYLFGRCWPNSAYTEVKVKSFKSQYKSRFLVARINTKDSHPIENCDFEFLCPILWEKLTTTGSDSERHCDKCNKTVYEVSDRDTLTRYAKMGRCVSLILKRDRDDYYNERLGGEAPPQRRNIPHQRNRKPIKSVSTSPTTSLTTDGNNDPIKPSLNVTRNV